MSKIIRTEPGTILSKAVEYHGFDYLPGLVANDTSKDVKAQTADILAQADAMLELHGTDKTRLLSAQIWLKDIERDFEGMNAVWAEWLPPRLMPTRATCEAKLASPELLVEIIVTAAARPVLIGVGAES